MSYPFTYTRPSDRITAGSWAVATGTPRTGYPVTNLDDGDPSNPLWIASTSLAVVRDFGTATAVTAVDIIAHTLANSAALHVQMHTADSWATPDVNVAVTIPTPYEDGFTYHVRAMMGGASKRYLRIVNLSANPVSVAIGEVCIWSQTRTLSRGVQYAFLQQRHRLSSKQTSKRGVATKYDLGSIERVLQVTAPASDSDQDDLRSLEAAARGDVRPFSVVLAAGATKSRFAEPLFVTLEQSVTDAGYQHPSLSPVQLILKELGQGELVGA